jgi:hypothetical protein
VLVNAKRVTNGKLCLILMELLPAPEKLLNIIRCNCKQNCDTKRCVCRKRGLQCSVGCGECRGLNCKFKNMPKKTGKSYHGSYMYSKSFEMRPKDQFMSCYDKQKTLVEKV